MKKRIIALTLCLTLVLSLSGCTDILQRAWKRAQRNARDESTERTAFADMTYTRPDLDAFDEKAESVMDLAEHTDDPAAVMDAFLEIYDDYWWFYTMFYLSDIRYSQDMTDEGWETEYSFCYDASYEIEQTMDQVYRSLANCPISEKLERPIYFGEGFFDSYRGESYWNETYAALVYAENDLISRYYSLVDKAYDMDKTYDDLASVYAELVLARMDIADFFGYDSYEDYCYDAEFGRAYTASEMAALCGDIQTHLAPLYRRLDQSGYWDIPISYSSERRTFDCVEDGALAMGGIVKEAFELLSECGLYDLAQTDHKYPNSFEVYLDGYQEPFVFIYPSGGLDDVMTFAHEFGHFCNDYANEGYGSGTDVSEVFSQGMEYLVLCYSDALSDAKQAELVEWKLTDCLSTYVAQTCFASFEHRVYSLPREAVTPERIREVYEQTCLDFCMDYADWDSREYVTITHFFTDPCYVASYVVSNDVAFQIYQMELENPGSGLRAYVGVLDSTEYDLLAFAGALGVASPMDPGRAESAAETLEQMLPDLIG